MGQRARGMRQLPAQEAHESREEKGREAGMTLTVGSLFSGIGGFELGLERTGGFKTVWQCEIDPFCQKVLAKHWPDVKRFTDIKEMGINEEIPHVDVICGGFPCQDISHAGKQTGICGARSGLFFELMRIVDQVRPKYIFLENVAALLNNGMGAVLGRLAESGYDARWDSISAYSVGAPHIRNRIFIIAHTNGVGSKIRPIEITGRSLSRHRVDCTKRTWGGTKPGICRMDDGIPGKLDIDRMKALGNAIVPQCAEYVGKCVLEASQ